MTERPPTDRATGLATPEHGTDQPRTERAEATLEAEVAGSPAIEEASLWSDAWRSLRRNPFFLVGALLLAVFLVMAAFPQLFTSVDPRSCDLARSAEGPSGSAWFGYDVQGCDYYANVVHGARVSVTIGFLAMLGTLALGIVIGSLAGYHGGWIDSVLARVTDIFYGLPLILGAFILLSVLPERGVLEVALALVVFGWMTSMRLVRSTVVSVKEADYVQAARALGAPTRRILVRHILPNAIAPVLVYSTIYIGTLIAAEATLTFLGIGLQLPEISWGLQINSAQTRLRDAAHLIFFPSIFLSLTVLSFILIGDALRDALDPKLR
ncbi:oligopeptide transport system permease protein [Geodermatophilus africanus]|uniref:Oligopeptide transport system permease protein n=1 Tax=Geodermatophilus africanus TaxID=1137993 RepID=A0A1H3M167_9ACTN|nr:ABC transporter permease [Geodermatophilus africanus]SDY70460.1 oligopeptide transport system permease protein [Geodermatophilus africanus]